MINKRLLIKNLLAHNDENSFYDKKRRLNIDHKEGKAKFLKHVCALANSNPLNNSYIVVGVEDDDNSITGVDFFDDSKIQNLINAYLANPPLVSYENIPFPHLQDRLVVGLVTIRPNNGKICSLRKNIWKYYGGSVFFRDGSISMPRTYDLEIKDMNSSIVRSIERHAQNNIELTLDGVFDFMNKRKDYHPRYKVFKEYFVVCWAGKIKKNRGETYYSRVDIELINEQVKLFYSDLDQVNISIDSDSFRILEYVNLGLHGKHQYYPLEEVIIRFRENAGYEIDSRLLFHPPQFDKKVLHHIYNTNNSLLSKLKNGGDISKNEEGDLINLPVTLLICHFNGFEDALEKLDEAREIFRQRNGKVYMALKETMRILRKVKYS